MQKKLVEMKVYGYENNGEGEAVREKIVSERAGRLCKHIGVNSYQRELHPFQKIKWESSSSKEVEIV